MRDKYVCPICGKEFEREDMIWSTDCHGIPFRLLCYDCYDKVMDEKGFDGEYYTELDECIDWDY
jgi:hypothetical protein